MSCENFKSVSQRRRETKSKTFDKGQFISLPNFGALLLLTIKKLMRINWQPLKRIKIKTQITFHNHSTQAQQEVEELKFQIVKQWSLTLTGSHRQYQIQISTNNFQSYDHPKHQALLIQYSRQELHQATNINYNSNKDSNYKMS